MEPFPLSSRPYDRSHTERPFAGRFHPVLLQVFIKPQALLCRILRIPETGDRFIGSLSHLSSFLSVFHQKADSLPEFLIASAGVNHAVFPMFYEIRNRSRFPVCHHGAAAVHGFIHHGSPAFQMIAGKKMDMAFFHSLPYPGRLQKPIHGNPLLQPNASDILPYRFLHLPAADEMNMKRITHPR